MAANLVIAVAVLATNLITDIAYAVVDPRVRYE
jgi:ABC-type dipeptide/oligopeptide/nickel transport system permease component